MNIKSEGQEMGISAASAFGVQIAPSLLFYFLMNRVDPGSRLPLTLLIAIPAGILATVFVLDYFTEFLAVKGVGILFRGITYCVMVGPQIFALMNLFVALNPSIQQPAGDRVVSVIVGAGVSVANLLGGISLKSRAEESSWS